MDFKDHFKETDLSGMSAHPGGTEKSVAEIFPNTLAGTLLYAIQYTEAPTNVRSSHPLDVEGTMCTPRTIQM